MATDGHGDESSFDADPTLARVVTSGQHHPLLDTTPRLHWTVIVPVREPRGLMVPDGGGRACVRASSPRGMWRWHVIGDAFDATVGWRRD